MKVPMGDVLTLVEAAVYLRVSPDETLRLVTEQGLPGRRTSDDWRFLKSALQAWLKEPERPQGQPALLALAGRFADDPDLGAIVDDTYRRRGQSESEASE